jgi:autotransporter-associated beta strand protein
MSASRFFSFSLVTLSVLLLSTGKVAAQTWTLSAGGSWNAAADWNPSTVPNAVGASVTFNGAATAANPDQTANRTVTLDGSQTVGSITFNNDLSTFGDTISTGAGGPLIFDAAGSGPATLNVSGVSGTGNSTISVSMTLNDSVTAFVNKGNSSSAAGALNLTGIMSGNGGFTKEGDGAATFGTSAKTYTGPTVLNGGRMRISNIAQPSATSGLTINPGGQLNPITAGTYQFGAGPMTVSGAGATSGPFAVFPGAIRPDVGLVVIINNDVILQGDTLIHVQATAGTGANPNPTGSITFAGSMSGPGKLMMPAPNSNIDIGSIILENSNTYSGGSLVSGGRLVASGASASFGTGNVTVDNSVSPSSIARVVIQSGVTNAISDTATLVLAGGGIAGTADQNYAELESGVNETVGNLVLAGVVQPAGTYGSSASPAAFKNDEFFAGPGMITVSFVTIPSAQRIDWMTIDSGGGVSTGAVFAIRGTIGQTDASKLSQGTSALNGGFWTRLAVVQSPGAPVLTITFTTTNTALVSWSSPSTEFVLQQNTNLNTTNWITPTENINDNGVEKFIIVSPPTGNRFYRLLKF